MLKQKVAVIGCGGMSNVWIEYLLKRDDVEIVALADIYEEAAQKMADKHNLSCMIFTDIEQAIKQSGAEIVIDVTIPASHYQVCKTALELGCHVLGEKPMAANMAEARSIVEIAEKSGKSFTVMQNRRYNENIRALRDMIAADTIGRVGYIGADFFLGPHFGGFREQMESPLIVDMAIHTFDEARLISGADPVSVYCQEFNTPGSWYEGNAAAICIFEMSDGSVFCYRGSWAAEGAPTSWEASWRITGEHGTAIWDGDNAPYAEVVAPGDQSGKFFKDTVRKDAAVEWQGQHGHDGCLDEMFAALREGRRAETDCHDNLMSIAMVFGALESAKTGQKIDLKAFIANGE